MSSPGCLGCQIEQLAFMIKKSKHLVVFTGAGISTSCGIPDFRGPEGIWTLQREGKGVPEASLPFHRAMPSNTHMALVELEKAGILKIVISQNVDSLHLRSGIPRDKLAELHGNSFREICPSCGAEYLRDFEVETIGMKTTPRYCSNINCGKRLKDTVFDWDDALPLKEMNLAEEPCRIADVVLCLGTCLQVTPACDLPFKSLCGGGKVVIVNLQQTPKDKKASLVIHGLVDKFLYSKPVLNFNDPCRCNCAIIEFPLDFETPADSINNDKDAVVWNLKNEAIQNERLGHFSVVERKCTSPGKEIVVYAIATDIVWYRSYTVGSTSSDNIPRKRHKKNNVGHLTISWREVRCF